MPARSALLALLTAVLGCSSGGATPAGPTGTGTPVTAAPPAPPPGPPPGPCGFRPGDWCPAPAGDPCGAHGDVASCKADARCQGMRYRGESVVACQQDDRGFATNCPTVGCVSR
jgi:hypothetical protein